MMSHHLNSLQQQLQQQQLQQHLQLNYQDQQQSLQLPLHQQVQQESDQAKFRRYFYNRSQAHGEKADDFLAELQRLASGAKLELEMPHSSLEALMRERFVVGLKNSHLQNIIMGHITEQQEKPEHLRDYALPRLLEIARQFENSNEDDDEDDEEDDEDDEDLGQTFEEGEIFDAPNSQQQSASAFRNQMDNRSVQIKKEITAGGGVESSTSGYKQQFITSTSGSSVFAEKAAQLRANRTKLSCPHCSFSCFTKILFTSHVNSAHEENSNGRRSTDQPRCDLCSAAFLSKAGLKAHLVMLHKKDKKEVFKVFDPNDNAGSDGSQGQENFDLDAFESSFGEVFQYENRKSFICDFCQFKANTATQLRKHIALFHQDFDARFQCHECLYRANSEDALIRHISKNHSKPLSQKFKCEICDFITTKKTDLTKHLQKEHRGQKVYVCDTCGKKFQTDKTLEVHYRVVHLNDKPFACTLCDYKAGQKASLIAHNHSVHEKSKPYVCENCGYKTTSQSTLNAHTRMVHQKARPYTCDLCGRSFAARAGMENHILLIHEKQMPFTCDRCGKKFKRRPDLNNHIRCIHEGNYFICNLCNNSFQTSRNLERHVATVHEQMKPFVCEVCGQSFARRERLKHHMERNHQGGSQGLSSGHSAANAIDSHHSNMASPQVSASPHPTMAPSPHPQNLVLPGALSHEHLLHLHQGQHHLDDQDHVRQRLLNSHHSQQHQMLLLMQQQQHHH